VRTNVSLWDAPPEVLMQQMGMMGQQMGGGIKTPFDSGSAQGRSGGGPHPVRPGESDCQFFLKTGNCKFGDGCKFNHPRDKVAAADEHPAREGMPDCSFYTKTGSCKFGASCKFNHPRSSGGQRAGSFSNNYDSQSAYH